MSKRKNDEFLVDNYLQRDEEVLWMGKPNPKRLLSLSDLFLIPFSLIWCTIAYGILVSAVMSFGLLGFGSIIIPHVWVAMWLFPGRFIHEYMSRKKTVYVVTNQRLLIINSLFGTSCKSYYIAQLPELDIRARNNNTGTIKFSGMPRFASKQNRQQSTASTDFYDIPDVWEVYHLIQDLHYESQMIIEEVEYEYYDEKPKLYARY